MWVSPFFLACSRPKQQQKADTNTAEAKPNTSVKDAMKFPQQIIKTENCLNLKIAYEQSYKWRVKEKRQTSQKDNNKKLDQLDKPATITGGQIQSTVKYVQFFLCSFCEGTSSLSLPLSLKHTLLVSGLVAQFRIG